MKKKYTILSENEELELKENIDDGINFNLDDKKMGESVLNEQELSEGGYSEEAVEPDGDSDSLFEDFSDDELSLDLDEETDLDLTDLAEDNLLNDQDILDDEE